MGKLADQGAVYLIRSRLWLRNLLMNNASGTLITFEKLCTAHPPSSSFPVRWGVVALLARLRFLLMTLLELIVQWLIVLDFFEQKGISNMR